MALGPPFFAAEARVRAFSAFGVQEASFGVHPQCCGCHDVGWACSEVTARAWGASVSWADRNIPIGHRWIIYFVASQAGQVLVWQIELFEVEEQFCHSLLSVHCGYLSGHIYIYMTAWAQWEHGWGGGDCIGLFQATWWRLSFSAACDSPMDYWSTNGGFSWSAGEVTCKDKQNLAIAAMPCWSCLGHWKPGAPGQTCCLR